MAHRPIEQHERELIRPELIGHRGAPRERPENTLASFLRALDLGAEAVELDVHATRDGVVVVHHDAVPRAQTSDPALRGKSIAELTSQELATFHVEDEPIPTLADVLRAVTPRATAYIELKGHAIEAETLDVVRRAGTLNRTPLHSFDHRSVVRARALMPGVATGILQVSYPLAPGDVLTAARARDCWQEWSLIDEDLVQSIHKAGGRVIAWTVNDASVARRLASIGVDGLCTDVLPLIASALQEMS